MESTSIASSLRRRTRSTRIRGSAHKRKKDILLTAPHSQRCSTRPACLFLRGPCCKLREGGDPRSPDIIVMPNVGLVYTGSTNKQAEHGGFAHADTNVMLLISDPRIPEAKTVTSFVETTQVAPTNLEILKSGSERTRRSQDRRYAGTPRIVRVRPQLKIVSENFGKCGKSMTVRHRVDNPDDVRIRVLWECSSCRRSVWREYVRC